MSAAVRAALRAASRALQVLHADIQVCGLRSRQRTPIKRLREQLDTVEWLIDYENSTVDLPQNDRSAL
jgi:hypothetical protein